MKKSFFVDLYKHIHFVGIGGIGMSALAKLCLHNGIKVSGSDKTKTDITSELEHLGIDIKYAHSKKNVENADLLVYTIAVGKNNVEVLQAQSLGIRVLERAEFLGEIAKDYDEVIAVSGSHGKTTVCAILKSIFQEAQKQPTVIVGGQTSDGNLTIGKKDFLIVEACEYMEHFLKIAHTSAVILNIDYDHPDYFKTPKDYEHAFQKFANNSTSITFGCGGDFSAKHICYKDDKIIFDTYKFGKFYARINLNVIGSYNVTNALAAIAVADSYGIDKSVIKKGIAKFEGVRRRFEYMGKIGSNIVITDYAHHPTQIKNCISATKEVYNRRITVVYEPHTYTRTKSLMNNFVESLSLANQIMILPTYSAREKRIKGGTSRDLYESLSLHNSNVTFVKSYKKCKLELSKLQNNVVLILGAGSIIQLARSIKEEYLSKKEKLYFINPLTMLKI